MEALLSRRFDEVELVIIYVNGRIQNRPCEVTGLWLSFVGYTFPHLISTLPSALGSLVYSSSFSLSMR